MWGCQMATVQPFNARVSACLACVGWKVGAEGLSVYMCVRVCVRARACICVGEATIWVRLHACVRRRVSVCVYVCVHACVHG